MTVFKKSIKITSQSKFQIINITQSINEIVNESHIKEGIISIFSKHSTTAICINEDEIGLKEDFKTFIEKLVPNDKYKHDFILNLFYYPHPRPFQLLMAGWNLEHGNQCSLLNWMAQGQAGQLL